MRKMLRSIQCFRCSRICRSFHTQTLRFIIINPLRPSWVFQVVGTLRALLLWSPVAYTPCRSEGTHYHMTHWPKVFICTLRDRVLRRQCGCGSASLCRKMGRGSPNYLATCYCHIREIVRDLRGDLCHGSPSYLAALRDKLVQRGFKRAEKVHDCTIKR